MSLRQHLKAISICLIHLVIDFACADPMRRQMYQRLESSPLTITDQPALSTDVPSLTFSITSSARNDQTNSFALSETGSSATPASRPLTPSAVTSAMNGILTPLSNSTGDSFELASKSLPIIPRITAESAVGGIILIGSGVVYSLTGVKNRSLQTFLSSAYLAALATTVLILYVTNVPISNTTQAAYVVAVILTSTVLGAASILLIEITEGLGSLLGGFCLSMWLLVLRPGGLLDGNGKIILIATLTIGGFLTTYIQCIRTYSLIVFISFGGATSIVIGIDCFSRAGLKEFCAYIWALNSSLFPPSEALYSLTRGMRVEIASILVISIFGIISQMKLWKIVQERRQKKVDEIFQELPKTEEGIKTVLQEQENLAKSKDQLEFEYSKDDKNLPISSEARPSNSAETETKSTKTLLLLSHSRDVFGEKSSKNFDMNLDSVNPAPITVRVIKDIGECQNHVRSLSEPIQNLGVGKNDWNNRHDNELGLERRLSNPLDQNSRRTTILTATPGLVNIPLPFKIPEQAESSERIRISVSTCATLGDDTSCHSPLQTQRQSVSTTVSRKNSGCSITFSTPKNLSMIQDLGVASNLDSQSNVEQDTQSLLEKNSSRIHSKETVGTIRISDCPSIVESGNTSLDKKYELEVPKSNDLDSSKLETNLNINLDTASNPKASTSVVEAETDSSIQASPKKFQGSMKDSKSRSSSVNSQTRKITKETLPRSVSKIFTSYRTNEWAKHLEYAEKPEIDDLQILEYSNDSEHDLNEKPAPVMVEELLQTPENPYPQITLNSSTRLDHLSGMVAMRSNDNIDSIAIEGTRRQKIITQTPHTSSHIPRLYPQPLGHYLTNHIHLAPSFHRSHRADSKSVLLDTSKESNMIPQTHPKIIKHNTYSPMHRPESNAVSKTLRKRSSGISSLEPSITTLSRAGSSEAESINKFPHLPDNDDTMSLSQRRNLIRQNSLAVAGYTPQTSGNSSHLSLLNPHQLQRTSNVPSSQTRQQKLAWWRASLKQDLQSSLPPQDRIEQQHYMLRESQKQDELRRLTEERLKGAREEAWNEMMRSKEMIDAHRDALNRLQQKANQNIS